MTKEQFKSSLPDFGFEPGNNEETEFIHREANLCIVLTDAGGSIHRFVSTGLY